MALRKLPFWSILENCKTFKILPKNLKHKKKHFFFIKTIKDGYIKTCYDYFFFFKYIHTFIPLPINKELCRIKFCLPADFILTKFLAQFFLLLFSHEIFLAHDTFWAEFWDNRFSDYFFSGQFLSLIVIRNV